MAKRAQWGRHTEFILTVVGYTVGLTNVLRFPSLLYRNGGAAFLIPYVICLVFMGIPVLALEMFLGQYAGKGPLSVWSINPVAKGVGFGLVAVSGVSMISNSVVISWTVRYLIASFANYLPWQECKGCACRMTSVPDPNCDAPRPQTPSEMYFAGEVLHVSQDIRDTGSVQWRLVLCNLAVFAVVFTVLCRGIRSLGKVAYITTLLPLLLMTVLLIRVSLLDGAADGVRQYLDPHWDRLSDTAVWADAAIQVLMSLGCCTGDLLAMASYNRFNNNIIRDALVVPTINFLVSLYAGFFVFATLGHFAHVKGITVKDIAVEGPPLAFVIFPEAIVQLPVSPLWAVLFFSMLCLLGLTTQFVTVETFVTAFVDESSKIFSSEKRTLIFRGIVCLVAFLLGIPLVTQSGPHLLPVVQMALSGIPTFNSALFLILVVCILYGVENFMEDMQTMVGRKPGVYFNVCWMAVSPLMLVATSVFMIYSYRPNPVPLVNLAFWLTSIFPMFCIPAYALIYSCKAAKLTQATNEWWSLRNKGYKEEAENGETFKNPLDGRYNLDIVNLGQEKSPQILSSEDGVVSGECYEQNGGFHEEFTPTVLPAGGGTADEDQATRL